MKSKILICVLTILFLASLGLGGYEYYKNQNEISDLEKKLNQKEQTSNKETSNYEKFKTNQIASREKFNDYKHYEYFIEELLIEGNISLKLKDDGVLNLSIGGKYSIEDYKLAENVLSFYVYQTGSMGANTIFIIYEDGTVGQVTPYYQLDNLSKNKIEVTKDDKYKNIVSIMPAGFIDKPVNGVQGPGKRDVVYIDIDGNIFSNQKFANE